MESEARAASKSRSEASARRGGVGIVVSVLVVLALVVGGILVTTQRQAQPVASVGVLLTGSAVEDPAVVSCGGCWVPGVETSWDWVLASVPAEPFRDVEMYDIDGFEATAETVAALHDAGIRTVCYVSGGTSEDWRDDFSEIPASLRGNDLDGWPGEQWLDVRDVQKPDSALAAVMNARLQMCASKGFDMVEWDNMDGYQNDPGFPLSATDQKIFNQFMFNNAHALGMAVLMKNDLDQIPELVAYADGILNEQCNEFAECDALDVFIDAGKPAFVAEYADMADSVESADFCASNNSANYNTVNFALQLDGSKFGPCR